MSAIFRVNNNSLVLGGESLQAPVCNNKNKKKKEKKSGRENNYCMNCWNSTPQENYGLYYIKMNK